MITLPNSERGVMLQSHAETLGFVARHRTKATNAQSADVRADRLKWAWAWLHSARKERIARQAFYN